MQQFTSRRSVQRAQLAADGRKAASLIAAGRTIDDVLLVVPGSRARLYRAIAAAGQSDANVGHYQALAPREQTDDELELARELLERQNEAYREMEDDAELDSELDAYLKLSRDSLFD